MKLSLAIIGDYNAEFKPHPATNEALSDTANALDIPLKLSWLPTRSLVERHDSLQDFDGFLIAPGSPYESMKGALMRLNSEELLHGLRWGRAEAFSTS